MRNQTLHNLAAPVNAWRIVTVLLAAVYVSSKILYCSFPPSAENSTVEFSAIEITGTDWIVFLDPNWLGLGRFCGALAIFGMLACIYIRRDEDGPGTWRMFGAVLLCAAAFQLHGIYVSFQIPPDASSPFKPDTERLLHIYGFVITAVYFASALAFLVPVRVFKWALLAVLVIPFIVLRLGVFAPDNPDWEAQYEAAMEQKPEIWKEGEKTVLKTYDTYEEGAAQGDYYFFVEENDETIGYVQMDGEYVRIDEPSLAGNTDAPVISLDWPMKVMYFIMLAYMFAPKHRIPRMRRLGEPEAP